MFMTKIINHSLNHQSCIPISIANSRKNSILIETFKYQKPKYQTSMSISNNVFTYQCYISEHNTEYQKQLNIINLIIKHNQITVHYNSRTVQNIIQTPGKTAYQS